MQASKTTTAQIFRPGSEAATSAAHQFIKDATAWAARRDRAMEALASFVQEHAGIRPENLVAMDPLCMTSIAMTFSGDPGAAFVRVPSSVEDDLVKQSVRGNAYFPDVETPVGRAIMDRMIMVSKISQERPLLNRIPGVDAVAIEGSKLVITHAYTDGGQIHLRAAPSAVRSRAHVIAAPSSAHNPQADAGVAVATQPRNGPRF